MIQMKKMRFLFAVVLAVLPMTGVYSQVDSLSKDSSLHKIASQKIIKGEGGKGYYEFIGQAQGSKEELFVKAKQALYRTFTSGDAVIQMEDKESGLIEGKGRTQTFYGKQAGFTRDLGRFIYRITIQTKDNKYRILFSEIIYEKGELYLKGGADIAEDYPSNWKHQYNNTEAWWAGLKKLADSELKAIAIILDSALNGRTKDTKDKW